MTKYLRGRKGQVRVDEIVDTVKTDSLYSKDPIMWIAVKMAKVEEHLKMQNSSVNILWKMVIGLYTILLVAFMGAWLGGGQ